MTSRHPTLKEIQVLKELFNEQHVYFKANEKAVEKLLAVGEAKNDGTLSGVDLAAGTVLAEALLNHDEAIMRR